MTIASAGDNDAAATECFRAGELQIDRHFCPHRDFLLGLEFDSAFTDAKGRGMKVVNSGRRLNGDGL
jgi:hypothetical protein